MRRLPDWDERLAAYLIACRGRSYHPALFNCGTFTAGAIAAQTGVDVTARFTPMADLLKDGRLSDFCGFMASNMGLAEVPPLQAMRGDPVAAEPPYGNVYDMALGICVGSIGMFLHPNIGFHYRDIGQCFKGWRI